MAIAHRVSSSANTGNGSASSNTINAPAGAVAGTEAVEEAA
jgi:hypothetical protein